MHVDRDRLMKNHAIVHAAEKKERSASEQKMVDSHVLASFMMESSIKGTYGSFLCSAVYVAVGSNTKTTLAGLSTVNCRSSMPHASALHTNVI